MLGVESWHCINYLGFSQIIDEIVVILNGFFCIRQRSILTKGLSERIWPTCIENKVLLYSWTVKMNILIVAGVPSKELAHLVWASSFLVVVTKTDPYFSTLEDFYHCCIVPYIFIGAIHNISHFEVRLPIPIRIGHFRLVRCDIPGRSLDGSVFRE